MCYRLFIYIISFIIILDDHGAEMDHRSWHLALFCLCILFGSGLGTTDSHKHKHKPKTPPASSGGQWCVASQEASDTDIQAALDYACGDGGADCSAIQPGASCYKPNTIRDHASYAFNDYYHKNPVPASCVFGGTATLTSTDPSSEKCHYASSASPETSKTPPTYGSPPSTPTSTPFAPTPPDATMPSGSSSVYGSEPTGSPNAATSASYSLLLLFACGFLVSLQVANYI